ncbi:MAG: hypothetical protein M3347_16490 [Armatimonadota bacterium]|nr:hypothetical protein [Armatimonadota bacterium]
MMKAWGNQGVYLKVLVLALFLIIRALPKSLQAQPSVPADKGKGTGSESREYNTGDKVPGDPANCQRILNLIYKLINIYRTRHDGAYPSTLLDVRKDARANAKVYGFDSLEQLWQATRNPDNQYADDQFIRQSPNLGSTIVSDKRFDGNPLGGPKPQGTRDVLAFTEIYVHRNARLSPEKKFIRNPVGFYLVLWDDGQVERVAYDQVIYAPSPDGFSPVFRGQTGIPANCLSYEEFETQFVRGSQASVIGYPIVKGQSEPVPDNGGFESLVSLARLLSLSVEREEVWNALGRDKKEFSIDDVQQGATKMGLHLQSRKLSPDELQKLGSPAVLYLSDVNRLVTLATLDAQQAIILQQGMTRIVSREVLAARYGGEALLPAAATNAAARVLVDDPIRTLELKSKDEEVTQKVTISNRSQESLTLQIERPIPGCIQAELSADAVAPGQSATLSLTLKWRDVLKSPTQNIFVILRTNDPVSPRVQLGFQLKLSATNAAP